MGSYVHSILKHFFTYTVIPHYLWGIHSRTPMETKIYYAQVPNIKWHSICV